MLAENLLHFVQVVVLLLTHEGDVFDDLGVAVELLEQLLVVSSQGVKLVVEGLLLFGLDPLTKSVRLHLRISIFLVELVPLLEEWNFSVFWTCHCFEKQSDGFDRTQTFFDVDEVELSDLIATHLNDLTD